MSSFKPPMSWMTQVFTKKELDSIKKKVEKLISDEEKEYKELDNHRQEILRDQVIVQNSNSELELPFTLTVSGGVIKHLKKINKNLLIVYPFYFDGDQFVKLEKSAKDAGFKIIVDPYASRGVGINLRVIIWKPKNQKNTKTK